MSDAKPKRTSKKPMADIVPAARKAAQPGPEEPVIYLEADEEITAATSRMLASSSDEVRIVVPKRSTLLQSVVNQKLLKRAADNAGKTLILVTADRTASHLAAQVGLPVASSVKAAAEVPELTSAPEEDNSDIVEAAAAGAVAAAALTHEARAAKPSPKPSYAKPMSKSQPRINNPFAATSDETAPVATAASAGKKAKKSRKVPDFNTLPKRVLIAAGVALFAILLMVAQYYFKRATVVVFAEGQLVDINTTFNVDTNADKVSVTTSTVPGRKYEISRDLSGSTASTGTKDVGTKASGTITLVNNCYNPGSVASGTRFTSGSGLVFVSTADVEVPDANVSAGSCKSKTASIPVTANQNGDQYNLAPTSYSSPGLPSSGAFNVKLNGGQMSGGSTKNIKVVTQADVDKVRNEAIEGDKAEASKVLRDKLTSSQMEVTDSFTVTPVDVVASPAVGSEGDQVTIKFKATYSLLAVQKDDMETLITAVLQKQVGAGKQIYQTGVDTGTIKAKEGGGYVFTSTGSAGEKIDTDKLIDEIKGKKTGNATQYANSFPGVSRAEITLSPAWSVKLPTIIDHIDVQIKVEEKSKP